MGGAILQERLSKAIIRFYLVSAGIITFGYVFEVLRIGLNSGIDAVILVFGIALNLATVMFFYGKKIAVESSFGIVAYTLFFVSISTSLIIINDETSHIYMIRDNMFFSLMIVFCAFIVGRMHALILAAISALYIIIYTVISENEFLVENIVLLLVIIIGLGILLYFLKSILDSALMESAKLNTELINRTKQIEEQNEILKEQSTELKLLNSRLYKKEEILLEQKNELHISNDTKNKLFSILAHDLKDLVSSSLGLSSILRSSRIASDKNKLDEFSKLIQINLELLSELLDNLLGWTRSQTKRIRFNKEVLNLFEIVNSAIQPGINRINDKNIAVNNNIPKDFNVLGDKNLLEIILRNLITNAVKFSDENSHINVTASELQEDFLIEIIDEGIGLDEKLYLQIFSLPPGENKRGTKGEKGTGLGLSICKEFVNLHGGNIGVKPNENKGSVFWFSLPKEQKK